MDEIPRLPGAGSFTMEKRISVIIPNYNSADSVEKCLKAAFASDYPNYEIVVVDDHSDDNSVEIIKTFPCNLVCLEQRSGTSTARNAGARSSSGEILFFIDSDCLLLEDTLSKVNRAFSAESPGTVIGGTYTRLPYDNSFFSVFQSTWIHYSETKNANNPDYIAAHAMIMSADTFKTSGGFPEDFLPIIEDVEFSHRMKRDGCKLVMHPEIEVRHIFGFTFLSSMLNAFRKTKYWCIYSLRNKDMLADSGTASIELKFNVASYALVLFLITLWLITGRAGMISVVPAIFLMNAYMSRKLLKSFYITKDISFAIGAFFYYTCGYPLPIGLGTVAAFLDSLSGRRRL
jgi:glycosyltransferase involved in cell wall biosynthesis